jgi:hypothetical protein
MNIVEGRTGLRRLSVPRRAAEREESGDRRNCDRRQQIEGEEGVLTEEVSEESAAKKFVRVSVTPGERTLIQDMYLIEGD